MKKLLRCIIIFFIPFISWTPVSAAKTPRPLIPVISPNQKRVYFTGRVRPRTVYRLGFRNAGIVSNVNVTIGDRVSRGQSLASFDDADAEAGLVDLHASFDIAQAQYEKALLGTSPEDIAVARADVAVAQATLDNAKKSYEFVVDQQQEIIDNDYKTLLNSAPIGIPNLGNLNRFTLTITGSYLATTTGSYTITVRDDGSYFISGLESSGGASLTPNVPQPIGMNGLYFTFPKIPPNPGDSWTVSLPNFQATTYIKNYAAYRNDLRARVRAIGAANATINSAQATLDQVTAKLAVKEAPTKKQDIVVARAKVTAAQNKINTATRARDILKIISPTSGIVTYVGVHPGEYVSAGKEAIDIMDASSYTIEGNVQESIVNRLRIGQTVDVVFHGLLNHHTHGTLLSISPGAVNGTGVPLFTVSCRIVQDSRIRSGMSAQVFLSLL